jgi:hypothetical protein
MPERRREVRLPTHQPVQISLVEDAAAPSVSGVLLETSDNGMLLELAAPLPYAAEVRLETCGTAITATVVRCQPQGRSYQVGVQLHQSLAKTLSIMEE